MAENYTKEFEEMFLDNKFGPNVVAETPIPDLTIDNTEVKTYFSPDDGVLSTLVPVLMSAEESIYFLAYSFTSNEMGDIVRQKDQDGLDVKGVMDADQVVSNQGTEYDLFKQAGMERAAGRQRRADAPQGVCDRWKDRGLWLLQLLQERRGEQR